jgi:hypothetical protein
MRSDKLIVLGVLLFTAMIVFAADAALPLAVPNASFESPATTFVNTHVDLWQKTTRPSWYNENGPFLWDQLTGVFKNTDPASPDHIDNCDGNQAMWMFAIPEVGIFQDYESMDWSHTNAALHAFTATYDVGKVYQFTVGLIGGGGNMVPGATIDLRFYYRDDRSNIITLASTTVTNSPQNFSNTTHFVDFSLRLPPVSSTDLWAGRHIGVELFSSITDTNLEGGYWDIDNVRLSIRNPILLNPAWTNGHFQFTVSGDPGATLQILESSDASQPPSSWTIIAIVPNVTGTFVFTDNSANAPQRFYQARVVP